MAQVKRTARKWGFLVVVSVRGAAILVEALFLVPVVRKQAQQSREGQAARDRQNQVFPVSCKVYVDAHSRGVISDAELRVFESPRRCPR